MMGSLGQQLSGKVQLDYLPSGFVYVLDVPLASLTQEGVRRIGHSREPLETRPPVSRACP